MTLTPEGFQKLTGVSRETLDRLIVYTELLAKWNERINLVGRNTIGEVWLRHVLDSAQLLPLIPRQAHRLVDLGSGAGLPGIVLGIMGVPEVHLIESDRRKAIFLAEAVRLTQAPVTVHISRIEQVKPFLADVVTARALAPLAALLELAEPFFGPGTVGLFSKGKGVEAELAALNEPGAAELWTLDYERLPSVTDKAACILRVENIARGDGGGELA